MASCEQNVCSCVINIGILLHNKLFKGNGIMKHIMFVFIYINNARKISFFIHIFPENTGASRPTRTAEGSMQPDHSGQKL